MAESIRIEINWEGLRQLLRSSEMKNICTQEANKIRSRLGEGYEVSPYTGKNRVNASIVATTYEAYQDNLENNTVLKAIGKGNYKK